MKTLIALGLASLMALSVGVVGTARSDDDDEQDLARRAFQRGEVLPIVRILALVTQHLPGDILEVRLDSRRGRLYYEIQVLTSTGRVRELVLDARTGAFVAIED